MEIGAAEESMLMIETQPSNQSSIELEFDQHPAEFDDGPPPSANHSPLAEGSPYRPSAKFALTLNVRTLPANLLRSPEPSISVSDFVFRKFIPEHVSVKRVSGRAYFYAILKHVLSPEEVAQFAGGVTGEDRSRLTSIPDWPYIGNLPLREVDTASVQRLITAALERGYSIQTATHIRNVVRSIFSHAAKTGHHSERNPADRVLLPAMSRKETPTLSLAQLGYLLHAMSYPERDLAVFALLAEMSVAEICGLQWKNVNPSQSSQRPENEVIPPLTIAVRWQRYRGRLDSAVGSRRRFVRVPQPLCLHLQNLRKRPNFTRPDDYVLVSRNGTPIHPENIAARRLKTVGKAFGMEWLSWSVFNRTGIRLRSEFGRSLDDDLAKLLAALT